MRLVLKLKFTQFPECRKALLDTAGYLLSEHTTRDIYWGDGGPKRDGKNMLGKLLIELRDSILYLNAEDSNKSLESSVDTTGEIIKTDETKKKTGLEEYYSFLKKTLPVKKNINIVEEKTILKEKQRSNDDDSSEELVQNVKKPKKE